MVRTFLEHILAAENVEEDHRVVQSPAGALVMSIQAVSRLVTSFRVQLADVQFQVHRALLYSVEGSFNPPRSKAGAFSKANWGDYSTQSQHGLQTVKRASVFMKKIKTLKEQQWNDIIQAARDTYEGNKPRLAPSAGEPGSEVEVQESDGDDEELMDPLYDTIA